MNADGGNVRRLTIHPAMDGRPSWGRYPLGLGKSHERSETGEIKTKEISK